MHSRLSPRERYDEWWRMRRGEARVCVGPRSAVFAPFDDLGLIIVDEEHDGSYKQEGDPRYDARAVAERRAADEGALLVAGSATPRPGEHGALRADRAAAARGRPRAAAGGARGRWPASTGRSTSARARRSTASRRRGEKAIVLLNRRGWSNFLSCRAVRARLGVPALRRHAGAAPRARRAAPATTAATASRGRACVRTAAPCRWRATARAPSSSSGSWRSWWRRCRSSGSTRTWPRPPGWPRCCAGSRGRRRACSWAPRWSPRAMTSRT